jgi:hypothetical protein
MSHDRFGNHEKKWKCKDDGRDTLSPFGNVLGIITTIDWRMAKFGDGNTRLSVFLVWSIFFFSDFGKCGFLGPW